MGNNSSSEEEAATEMQDYCGQKHKRRSRKTRKRKRFIQIGKITVSVIKGSIIDQSTDVIVNAAVPSLDLTKARTSKLLLESAGDSVQDECNEKYPSGITFGDVAVTGPGKLDCQHIFHVTLEKYSKTGDEKNIDKCIENCIREADKLSMTSVAFPALGTGFLGYSAKLVASSMFHAIENIESSKSNTSVKLVNCVVFDEETFKEILAEAKVRAASKGLETLSIITRASCSTTIGKIHISVIVDTLTSQTADVIVCTCAQDLKLSSRKGLSDSISTAAGSGLQSEITRRYPNGITTGDLAVTNGHNLHCRKVYLGCLLAFFAKGKSDALPEQVLYKFVYECLQSASKHTCRSIAFPALGTGYLKFPPDLAASKVIQSIRDFQSNHQQTSLREIKIVIFGGSSDWAKIEKAYIKYCNATVRQQTTQALGQRHQMPQRGSRAYFSFKYQEEPRPPNYWSHFKRSKSIKEWNTIAKGNTSQKVQPDVKIVQSITNAFCNTMGHHSVTVKSVERIENILLFEQYAHEIQRCFRKASMNGACIPLANTKGSRGGADVMSFLDSDMTKELHSEINEVYLFHGTKRNLVDVIGQQGFDDRLAKMNFGRLRLGNGIYSAELAHVSNDYTDKNGDCKMFLMRVCLGDVYTTPSNIEQLTRPPCKSGCIGVCLNHPELYDSVVGDWVGYCREFTVYDRAKCYPEYIITYTVP